MLENDLERGSFLFKPKLIVLSAFVAVESAAATHREIAMILKMISGIPVQIWGCQLGSTTQPSYLSPHIWPLIYTALFSLVFLLNAVLDNDLQIFILNKNVGEEYNVWLILDPAILYRWP